MSYKASAPGSMMLFGEYAVLHEKPALVCAVDKRVEVILTPREDDIIRIDSDRLGQAHFLLKDIEIERPFQFILAAVKQFRSKLTVGFDLKINSECSHQVGLGSSAAVTVATSAALMQWLNIRMGVHDFIKLGRGIVRDVQNGVGSGADIAASVLGGVVQYQMQPFNVEKIPVSLPLIAYYAGFKTPTAEAINRVQTRFSAYPQLFRQICQAIGQCVVEAVIALRAQDFRRLGELMTIHQGFHESLGVGMPVLYQLVDALSAQPQIHGAKISGSGLGDCVIGLGKLDRDLTLSATAKLASRIPVQVTMEGVRCEKI